MKPNPKASDRRQKSASRPFPQSETLSSSQKAYLARYKRKKRLVLSAQLFLFLQFVILWEVLANLQILNPFIFSSPSRILATLRELFLDGSLLFHTRITLMETLISFTLVNLAGLLFAILLWWNDWFAAIFDPYLVILNSLPKTALAPLFIVWLGNNMKTILVAAVSVAVFGTILTLYHSFLETEPDKIKLIQTFGGTKRDILLRVVIPASLPAFLSLMKVNIGLSLVGVIIGEFLAAKSGLGYLIIYGEQVFRLDLVLLAIVILCLVATLLYKLLSLIEKRVSIR